MTRLGWVAGALAVMTVAAGCGLSQELAPDRSGELPAATGVAATPRPSPLAIQADTCTDTLGTYTVHLPNGWWTNPEFIDNDTYGFVPACRFFAPAEFDPMSGRRDAHAEGVAITVTFLELCPGGEETDILDQRATTVDGYPARAWELGDLANPSEPYAYQYLVTLSDQERLSCAGHSVFARTGRESAGAYADNRAALDEIMESIEIDPAPVNAACEDGEVTLAHLLARELEPRVDCFGSRPVSFRAYVSPMVGDGTCLTGPVASDEGLPMCDGPSRILVPLPGDEYGLTALLPEDMDLDDVPADTWIVATGHFDDPAASTCAGHDAGVFLCRLAFVLDSVELEQ
jgi:hypothetical protein